MDKNNLIIVDVQNGFTKKENTKTIVPKIVQLLSANIFDVVIATRFKNYPGSHYENFLNWKGLESSEEQAIPEDFSLYIDKVIEKETYNCVTSNFLDIMRELNCGKLPDVVYVVGVDTDCCVQTISVGLFDNKIRPVVLEYYCDSNGGPKFHEAGILSLKRSIGFNAIVSGEITSRSQLETIYSDLR